MKFIYTYYKHSAVQWRHLKTAAYIIQVLNMHSLEWSLNASLWSHRLVEWSLGSLDVYKFGLCAGIFKQSRGARNRVGIELSYRPATLDGRIDSLESIPGLPTSFKNSGSGVEITIHVLVFYLVQSISQVLAAVLFAVFPAWYKRIKRQNYFPPRKPKLLLDFESMYMLKVPKCEIFDRPDFHYFYTRKPFWVGDFGAKIWNKYFNFWGSSASINFWCAPWACASFPDV
jgi:hypothetical protein